MQQCHAPRLVAVTKFKTTKINFESLFGLSTKIRPHENYPHMVVSALKCMIRAVEMMIKWLVCSVFSIDIAQSEFFLFLKYWLLQNRYLDSRLILLSRMPHNIATA